MSKLNRTEIILRVVAGVGVMSLALVAPNAAQYLIPNLKQSKWPRQKIHRYRGVVHKLKERGLIEFKPNHDGLMCVSLTRVGKAQLTKYDLGKMTIAKPKHWDGKYRLIIFDIKEWKRATRDRLRRWLIKLGFVRLQNSVWVYPYDCEEIVVMLKAQFKIGQEVLTITAEKIENDRWLKREFGLASPTVNGRE